MMHRTFRAAGYAQYEAPTHNRHRQRLSLRLSKTGTEDGGVGGGNERPCSADGGAETPARMLNFHRFRGNINRGLYPSAGQL